jgi:Sec-independent protein secretion pathway component TatC
VAAIVTPPDVVSPIVAIPMLLIYEGIFISVLVTKNKKE